MADKATRPNVQSADSAANSNPPKDPFDRYGISTEDPFQEEIAEAKAARAGGERREQPRAEQPRPAPEQPKAPAPEQPKREDRPPAKPNGNS